MNKNYGLILDDVRSIEESLQISNLTMPCFEIKDFSLTKNYEQFCDFIKKSGVPTFVSFDHDLGLDEMITNENGFHIVKWSEKTGLDCAKFLVDYCHDNNHKFPLYRVHSANPVGKENIRQYIRSAVNSEYISLLRLDNW